MTTTMNHRTHLRIRQIKADIQAMLQERSNDATGNGVAPAGRYWSQHCRAFGYLIVGRLVT